MSLNAICDLLMAQTSLRGLLQALKPSPSINEFNEFNASPQTLTKDQLRILERTHAMGLRAMHEIWGQKFMPRMLGDGQTQIDAILQESAALAKSNDQALYQAQAHPFTPSAHLYRLLRVVRRTHQSNFAFDCLLNVLIDECVWGLRVENVSALGRDATNARLQFINAALGDTSNIDQDAVPMLAQSEAEMFTLCFQPGPSKSEVTNFVVQTAISAFVFRTARQFAIHAHDFEMLREYTQSTPVPRPVAPVAPVVPVARDHQPSYFILPYAKLTPNQQPTSMMQPPPVLIGGILGL